MANPLRRRSQALRNPGQSVEEEIERVVLDDFLPYCLIAGLLWTMAVAEWVAMRLHAPRSPCLYAAIATVATLLGVVKFLRAKRRVRHLKQGRDGERHVAEILEEIKAHGASVLHDIPDENGNVDHVVISTRGLFVIETKAWSKPDRVWKMQFDGERILIPTRPPDVAPITQCRAQVGSIRELLRESTSKSFAVRGVVVFLDWYVTRMPAARGSDIWVLNPKELAGWIRREPELLSSADVAMVTLHLKQYVKRLAA